jgi:TfoX/Sxy family transcriptional regulator of competence genes
MAYNLDLAKRISSELEGLPCVEKKMFGGTGFLIHGNMACGVIGDGLIVRVPPAEHAGLLKRPHVRVFDFSGRPMKGWLIVEADGYQTAAQLHKWVKIGVNFALTLPPK